MRVRRAMAVLAACILFLSPMMCVNGAEDTDVRELESYILKLVDTGKYEDAGRLYERIAIHHRNESDWGKASEYHLLAAGNFVKAERYEPAGASCINAGDCFYEMRDCDNASKYYLLGAENYKKSDQDYDDSWIEEKVRKCTEKSVISGLAIIGILFGMIKFAGKAALGLGFASVGKKGILTIAGIYFLIPLLMSVAIGAVREMLYEFIDRLFDFGIAFGAFQLMMALLLLTLGLYTIRKWKDKNDISKKTFLLMVIPCPVSLVTMFMTCAFFIIAGIDALKVGLLVGGVFSLFILGIMLAIQRFKLEKSPANLGTTMIFFGMLYLLSIVLIPAYLPLYDMAITIEGISSMDMINGSLFAAFMIFIGFLVERIKKVKNKEWTIKGA
ncbi:hypothetical protein DRN76_00505 [Methanosarcinales archaeon]|nr:MAG: hypothetical protein DRN76_00505 [Methanosarcinales archaeon]